MDYPAAQWHTLPVPLSHQLVPRLRAQVAYRSRGRKVPSLRLTPRPVFPTIHQVGLSCLSHHDSWIPAAFGHRLQLGDQLILSGSMSAVASVTAFAPLLAEDGQNETEVWEPIMTTQRLTERWFYWGMDRPDPTGLGMVAAAWLVPAGLFLMLVLA